MSKPWVTDRPARNTLQCEWNLALDTMYLTAGQKCFPSPPLLVAYGLEGTDKVKCITSVLEAGAHRYAFVRCADCLSQRHLLSKIFSACNLAVGDVEHIEEYGKIDTLNSLLVNLQKLFERTARDGQCEKLVLVLEGIDEQRGGSATLLPSLARLPDLMPFQSALTLILVSSASRPFPLHYSGALYMHFPPYTRNEAINIVTKNPPLLQPDPGEVSGEILKVDQSILLPIYAQFCAAIYDSLIAPTSSTSLSTFRTTCTTLWPTFIWPLLSSETPQGKARTWDFQRLLVRNRSLFQTAGESILVNHLCPPKGYTFQSLSIARDKSSSQSNPGNQPPTPLLKPFPTLLLLSCYLASHTNAKVDILLFSRLSSSSKSARTRKNYHKRKHLKAATASFADTAAEKNALKASKKLFDAKSGVGKPFVLERVLAILRAVHPEGIKGRKGVSDAVYRGVGELERLGLVRCADGGEEGESTWRVNVRREWVEELCERIGLGVRIGEYEVQGD